MSRAQSGRMLGLGIADVTALIGLRPDAAQLVRDVAAPHAWLVRVGADTAAGTLVSAALWCAAVWLGLGLAACLSATLPGTAGRIARSLAAVVLPRAMYRLLAGGAGLGVLLAPALTEAASAGPATPPAAAASTPAPAWPTDDALPAPAWPLTTQPPTPHVVARPVVRPSAAGSVVVEPGDCLWQLTAEHLPARAPAAQIAAQWPRWYAANRRVIGSDPAHLVPGEVLRAPAPIQEASS